MSPINGPEYYRSIAHLAGSAELRRYVEQEFPGLAEAIDSTNRRQFLRLLGASMALAGVTSTGCRRWPVEEVRPHSSRPEGFTPGAAEHYATSIEIDGVSTGLLVKSYDGRPIKIEGNPDHPFSRGAASAMAQASVLELYDPDRSRTVIQRDTSEHKRTWDDFHAFATFHFQALRARQGDGLAFLVQPSDSPTWQRLRGDFVQAFPKSRWFEYQPLHRDNEHAGSLAAFGSVLRPQCDLSQASVILSFDADLLGSHPAHLKHARDWAAGRRSVDHGKMSRMIAVEPGVSITGSVADVRLPLKPSLVEMSAAYVAYRFGLLPTKPAGLSNEQVSVLEAAAADLRNASSLGIAVAGPAQSAATHQLVHAINAKLGSVGSCVTYTEENTNGSEGCVTQISQLSQLLQGNVLNTLVIVGGNPIYDAPADTPLNLKSDGSRLLTSIHLSLHDNETSQACSWQLPAAHFLESWGDGRAWDGTYTLQQPLILPLYHGKSPIEFLAMLCGQNEANGLPLVRRTFDELFPASSQQDWEVALHDGLKTDSGYRADETSNAIQFVSNLPSQVIVDEQLLARGKQRFRIYCSVCHGDSGTGDGPVNLKAIELKETKWVPATNLMTQEIRARPDGQIYQAIRDGVGNMPSYKSQIDPKDRWAIVAYLRNLQANSPVAPPTNPETTP